MCASAGLKLGVACANQDVAKGSAKNIQHIVHIHPQIRAQAWQGYIVHFDISQSIPTALKNQFKKVKDTISLPICISMLVQRALCVLNICF